MSTVESVLTAPPWADYDPEDQATWTVMEAPPVERAWEQELARIGGMNPFGRPNLVWRWGATYRDPMAEDDGLKYWLMTKEPELVGFEFTDSVTGMTMTVERADQVPKAVLIAEPKYEGAQLGERRIIIEQWTSPERLAKSGRYHETMLLDAGRVYEWFFCKNCHWPLVLGGPDNAPLPCPSCGSKRHYVREHREEGEGRLLRSFPREGCYDYFLRLENQLGEPMPADGHALELIRAAWHSQQNRTDDDRQQLVEATTAQQRATQAGATSPYNPFAPPAREGW